ncbi:hypothetical protein L195_g059408, partial [Trifolium pratense]
MEFSHGLMLGLCDGSLSEVVKTEPSEEGESANPVIHQGMRGPQ